MEHELAVRQHITAGFTAGENHGRHAVGRAQYNQPDRGRTRLDGIVHEQAGINGSAGAVNQNRNGFRFADAVEMLQGQRELECAGLGNFAMDFDNPLIEIYGLQRNDAETAGETMDDVLHTFSFLTRYNVINQRYCYDNKYHMKKNEKTDHTQNATCLF